MADDPIYGERNKPIAVYIVDACTGKPVDFSNLGVSGPGSPYNQYGSVTGVSMGTETVLISKTVAAGKKIKLQGFHATGNVDACFKLKVNAAQVSEGRTSPTKRQESVVFENGTIDVEEGDLLELTVEHSEPSSAAFQGNFFGNEVDL